MSELYKSVGKMADQVNYQDGTIVSKTLVKKQTGTLSLFAFDSGQELSEHTAPFDAMVQVLDGRAEVIISGEIFDVEQGEAIIMPANEPHSVRAVERFKMFLIMIRS